jgi:3-oxoacyl-[acyl-carrier protein] reductase
MSSNKKTSDENGVNRRDFLVAGAAGMAAVGSMGVNSAMAEPKPPGDTLRTNSKTGIRTAIITDAQLNIGPFLAKKFAKLGYNLVLADVQKGLPDELRKLGAGKIVEVPGIEQEAPNHEGRPGVIQKVVDACLAEFGGYDSAFIRTAVHHPPGDIFQTTAEGLHEHYEQNLLAVMYALQATLPPLEKAGGGQVVVQTSATGEKPQPTLTAYSTMRAAANMMCRCAAMTVAPKNVTLNVIGTNFMNYPGFREAAGAEDEKVYQSILKTIPMGRLGETEEAAHFALSLLDGYNMYTTGNFFPVAGGFNNAGMTPFGA